MPYRDAVVRRKMNAERMRRWRIYEAAVAAGTHESKEAERWRKVEDGIELMCAVDPKLQQHRLRFGRPTVTAVRRARARFYELRDAAIDAYLKAQIFS